MKKLLSLGLLALCFATTEQTGSAWVNSKFGIGLNWNWQSGGNNFLWGLFRNGQPPGPGCDGGLPFCPGAFPGGFPGGPGCGPGGYGGFTGFGPSGPVYGPQEFQYFGKNPVNNGGTDISQNQPQQPAGHPAQFRTSSMSYYPSYYPYYYPTSYWPSSYYNYATPASYYGQRTR